MYILFYPLKFPSTPVLTLFKVLQHHNNLLWPRQDSNLHSPIGIMTTSRPVFILESNLWQFATLFLLTVRFLILHTSLLSRVTLPFCLPGQSGRQDSNLRPLVRSVYKIRTYDTSFIIQTHQFLSLLVNCNQNQCSSQLNYFPKCVVFYNTFFICSAQQNRTAIPRMKILWPDH